MQFRDWLIKEMPLTNFKLMGKWGEKDKLYHYDKPSVGMLTSPKGVAQIYKKWSNTKENFNLYFLKGPKVWQQIQKGVVMPEWVEENLGITIPPDEFAISVIFTQNMGTGRVPMTGWTIAHRLGHGMFRDSTFENYFWNEMQKSTKELLKEVYNLSQPGWWSGASGGTNEASKRYSAAIRALYQAIGTMRSARTNQLDRPNEFIFELVAQYVTTGRIKFNAVPQHLKLGQRLGYVRANPQNLSAWNDHLDVWASTLEHNLDSVFTGLTGKILVM